VQTIVRKLGGNIQVTSKPGDTRFQVWLPCAAPSEPGEPLGSAVTLRGPEGNGVTPASSLDTAGSTRDGAF